MKTTFYFILLALISASCAKRVIIENSKKITDNFEKEKKEIYSKVKAIKNDSKIKDDKLESLKKDYNEVKDSYNTMLDKVTKTIDENILPKSKCAIGSYKLLMSPYESDFKKSSQKGEKFLSNADKALNSEPNAGASLGGFWALIGPVLDALVDARIQLCKSKINDMKYENGNKISIGCSRKGRIWSFSHDNLLNYILWCKRIGKKVIDETITQDNFLNGFLIPIKVTARPELVPIAVDWHGDTYSLSDLSLPVSCGSLNITLVDLDLYINSYEIDADLQINICFEDEVIAIIKQEISEKEVTYSQISGNPVFVQDMTLAQYFDESNPRIWFENSNYLEGNLFFSLHLHQKNYFSDAFISPIDWNTLGTDITVESQGFKNPPKQHSIQYQTIKMIESEYDFIFNDDNSGEIADIIAIKVEEKQLKVSLYHCKFSKKKKPNSEISNFYEVCGQAQKCIRKIENHQQFFQQLKHREEKKLKKGATRIIKGDYALLNKIHKQSKFIPIIFDTVIVQPGLGLSQMTDDVRILLGNTQLFLNETMGMPLSLLCSH